MKFVERDRDGKITGVFINSQYYTQEAIEEDSVELAAFYTAQLERDKNAKVLSALRDIDLKSIRSIREWLVAQPDAPQFIKDHEVAAVEERAKLK